MVKVQRIIVPDTRERSWVLFDAEHQPLIASQPILVVPASPGTVAKHRASLRPPSSGILKVLM